MRGKPREGGLEAEDSDRLCRRKGFDGEEERPSPRDLDTGRFPPPRAQQSLPPAHSLGAILPAFPAPLRKSRHSCLQQ